MDIRCFIAIELPEEIRQNLNVYVERLRATNADVKWVSIKNVHLTLKFLGSTPEALLPDINKRLLSAVKLYNSFNIQLFGAGVFPNIKQPRVIWVGIQDSEVMIKLQQAVDGSMAELGFEKDDRQFKPHLTIGRVRSLKNKEILVKELATLKDIDFGKIEVRNIVLMKSELKPGGAEHFRLSEILLGK